MPNDQPTVLALEIRDDKGWRPIGNITRLGAEALGLNAPTEFWYDLDYAAEHVDRADFRAATCAAPVGFEPLAFEGWPPFLLDLFPQGAALRYVVEHYRIADRPENYWKIIKTARLNPPGNLRVVSSTPPETAAEAAQASGHRGFERAEVVAKGQDFLNHMIEHGAPVAGTTGAGGAAPKFLLREDMHGRFHADGTLPDALTARCWLVKFPRGRTQDDEDILRSEKSYIDIAKLSGLHIHEPCVWESDCLFVPRFDRDVGEAKIVYLGMESFYSLVGLPEFGSRLEHETYVRALARFSSGVEDDVIEYVLRDFLNVMMGNTDNHGRNSSVLKGDGWVRLSPLYDFAPMRFDPEGIVRSTRWGEATKQGDIGSIEAFLTKEAKVDPARFKQRVADFHRRTSDLEPLMRRAGIPERFVANTAAERIALRQDLTRYLGAEA